MHSQPTPNRRRSRNIYRTAAIRILSAAAIASQTIPSAFAVTKIWLDTDGLFWNNTAGWSTGVLPVVNDDVQVGTHSTSSSNPILNFTSNLTGAGLGSLTMNSNGSGLTGTMTLSQTLSTSAMVATLEIIGDTITGNLYTQNAGTNSANTITLGNTNTGNGIYTLNGNGSVSALTFNDGLSGTGTVNHSAGNVTISTTLNIAQNASSTGSYNLSGTGNLTAANETLANGNTSVAFFNQSNGTNTISGNGNLVVGQNGAAVYTLSNGTLNNTGGGFEFVGSGANSLGTFTQSNGTNNVTTLALASNLGTGNYNLQGGNLNVTNGNEFIGNGLFNQTGGNATFTNANINIGLNSTGNANYSLQNGNITINGGSEQIGYFGSGNFTQISGNNLLNSNSALAVGYAATGNYSLQSGNLTLAVGNEFVGYLANGTFTQSGGNNSINSASASFNLGVSSNTHGTYNLQAGNLTVAGTEIIASGGNATFTQSGGSNTLTNSNNSLLIGTNSGADGTYNLQAGNLTNAGSEIIADGSTGSFNQSGGNHTVTGTLTIGLVGNGAYTLSNPGVLTVTHGEYVGSDLTVSSFTQSGGTHNVSSFLIIGLDDTTLANGTYILSNGTLNVLGGGYETVGDDGIGSFQQSGGLNNVTGNFFLGAVAGGIGSETDTYNLSNGTLAIAGGENIGWDTFGIFTQTGGINTAGGVTISANGQTSSYTLSAGSLTTPSVFVSFHGTFTINGGTANLTGGTLISNSPIPSLSIPGGIINLSAGTLNVSTINLGGAPADFIWTGGTLGLTSGVTFDPNASPSTTSAAFGSSLILNSGMNLNVTGNEIIGGLGFFTLTLNSGSNNTVSGTLQVAPTGTLIQNGASINQSFLNQGNFIYEAGTFNGQLNNAGTANFLLSGNLTLGLTNSGTIAPLNLGVTLTLGGSGLNNSGSITLNGGGISGAILNNGLISGFGSLGTNATSFNNTGDIIQSGGNLQIFSSSTITNGGTLNLASGLTLSLVGPAAATNDGTINLNSGTLAGTLQLTNNSAGLISGPGKISLTTFINNGTFLINTGTTSSPLFTNNGVIEMAGAGATLLVSSGNITNSSTGTIEGFGKITAAITNNGIIEPTGGTLILAGALTNPANGTLVADTGTKLLVSSGLTTNAGLISLTGGTFDNGGHPLNNTGQITGYGTFRAGGTGLTNNANITFTGGTTTLNANITNNANKTINIKYQPAIITGNIDNFGTIKTTNTTTTYTGNLTNETGSAYTSDPSTNIFQNNLTNAGSITGGTGDVFIFLSGTVNNSGTFTNGGTLQSSDNITNPGTFIQTGPQTWSNGTTFSNSGNATLTTDTGTASASPLSIINTAGKLHLTTPQHLNSLTITGGNVSLPTTANPRQGTGVVLKMSTLSIAATSVLDITNHDLIIGNTSYAAINNEILNTFNAGNGLGGSISSSTAAAGAPTFLVPIDAGAFGTTSFDNVAVDQPNSVIVKYDTFGDVNLDGVVDGNDIGAVETNFGQTTPGISNIFVSWLAGDVNFDGIVDGNDIGAVESNFGAAPEFAGPTGPSSLTASPSAVPEPASLFLLGLGSAAMLLNRKRRSM